MKTIQLTQDKVALVDDEDFDRINQFRWYAAKDRNNWYALRNRSRSIPPKRTLSMHRFIMNTPKGLEIDHRNNIGLDNRKENLRVATAAQNQQNRHKIRGESQYRGVSLHRGKWMARITLLKKGKFLGYFSKEEDAALAYNKAATKHFGQFACLNDL